MEDLEAVAKWEGLEFKHGDILIVRSGFTRGLQTSPEKQEELLGAHRTVGVEGDEKTARWVWNRHFAAVVGDAIAFENLPPTKEDGSEGTIGDLGEFLHPFFSEPNSVANSFDSLAPILPGPLRA